MLRWLAIGMALGAALAMSPSLSMHVTPTMLFEGNAVRVQCRVPLNAANRRLQIALEGYRYSEVPLLGDAGPMTTEVTYDHVPCEVEAASCTVLTDTGTLRRVHTALTVICRS